MEEPTPRPSRRKLAAGIGITLLLILLIASASYYQLVLVPAQVSPPGATTPSPTPGVVTFVFTIQDERTPWAFMAGSEVNPTLRAKVGDTIRITLHNTGNAPHDLWIEGLEVHIPQSAVAEADHVEETGEHEEGKLELWPREQDSITFTAEKAGTFAYYCTLPGHRDLGMEGQIIIEQAPRQTPATPTPTPTPSPTPTAPPAGKVVKITMELIDAGSEWAFTVDGEVNPTIRVKVGDTVELTLINTGQTVHDITVEPFGVTVKETFIAPGESVTVTFVADKPGTYEYYCSQPGHEQLGMIGVIIVE